MSTLHQTSSLSPDSCLYCDESYWSDNNNNLHFEKEHENFGYLRDDEDDHDDVISLLSKEKNIGVHFSDDESLMEARIEALVWMIRANVHHNFSVVTLVLGVNYFDRFIFSVGFQRERPWMFHLVAVASLSLASKFEETHVPLLLQLRVDCKYNFEAETIKRMELLILSTLEWKMNAVTPLSYFRILIRRFNLKSHHHWEILCRCETLILSAITDSRFLQYAPSVLAASSMVHTLNELELWNPIQHQSSLLDTFKLDKDKMEECYKFIQEISSNDKSYKRKYSTLGDNSPSTVLDIGYSESSASEESISSLLISPEYVPKKCRTQESF